MTHYRAYLIGRDSHLIKAVDFNCDDDEAAKKRAERMVDGHDVELRRSARAGYAASHNGTRRTNNRTPVPRVARRAGALASIGNKSPDTAFFMHDRSYRRRARSFRDRTGYKHIRHLQRSGPLRGCPSTKGSHAACVQSDEKRLLVCALIYLKTLEARALAIKA
jgi:hypothetical protein